MQSERMNDGDGIDTRLTHALERKPAVDVPADFAARVAAQVAARREVAVVPARYGLMTARIGMAMLLVALMVVATRSIGHTVFGVTLEWILCAELAALAAWLSGVWKPMRS
jgi:hypothetical protein